MLKIGEFSRIAHVSIKTLRYYAHEGLLEPVWIDRFSGYRYYSLDQLPVLNRILVLKDLGFSLDQIKQLVKSGLSIDELLGMLRIKKTELMLRVQDEQMRLARVENRLQQIETEGSFDNQDVLLKPISACLTVWAKTRAATMEQAQAAQDGLQKTILNWCELHRIRVNGPWFSLFENGSYSETNVDIHLGVLVDRGSKTRTSSPVDPVRLSRMMGIPMAACLLTKPSQTLPLADLAQWIENNGYRTAGDIRLMYLGETPESALGDSMVEIQIPVRCELPINEINHKEMKMEPVRIESLPSFKVMGLKYRGRNENNEIAAMWTELNPVADKIPMIGSEAYGVCLMISDAPQGVFEYIAGYKVADDAIPPEGMVVVDVPANKYAVFKHLGSMETLRNTYNGIINEWYPRSGLKPYGRYDMEIYNEEFKEFSPESVLYIYEPVK